MCLRLGMQPVPATEPEVEPVQSQEPDEQTQVAAQMESIQAAWIICVRSFGRPFELMQQTLKVLDELLLESEHVQVFVFLSPNDAKVLDGSYASVLCAPWSDRVIFGVSGAEKQVAFVDACAAETSGAKHVVIMDDNINQITLGNKAMVKGELGQLIAKAGQQLVATNSKIWGINPSTNPFFCSEPEKIDLGLGLIFGGMFGIIATGDSDRYSKYGQIRDDVERSMRYWHLECRCA